MATMSDTERVFGSEGGRMTTVKEEVRKVYVVRTLHGRRRRYITESAAYRGAAWVFYRRRDEAAGDMWWEAPEGQDRRRKVVARLARWLRWRDRAEEREA